MRNILNITTEYTYRMDLIPGFLQGLTRVMISYPFDYIRTHIQTQKYETFKDIIKQNKLIKIRDVYRGCHIPLITVPTDRALQFYIFENLKKSYTTLVSSIATSLFSMIYSVPSNYLSTLVITNNKSDVFKNFLKSKNYYKGLMPELFKNFLGTFVYTSSYGLLRDIVPTEKHNYFLFGVCSSISSWMVIYPLDTFRVIRQTSNNDYRTILKTNSIKNYYKGLSLVLMRSVPSAGMGMFVYEKSRNLLQLA